MRFLTADYLHPLHTSPIKEGVLQISNEGEVIAIFENREEEICKTPSLIGAV